MDEQAAPAPSPSTLGFYLGPPSIGQRRVRLCYWTGGTLVESREPIVGRPSEVVLAVEWIDFIEFLVERAVARW